jgi:hypothetical protein
MAREMARLRLNFDLFNNAIMKAAAQDSSGVMNWAIA